MSKLPKSVHVMEAQDGTTKIGVSILSALLAAAGVDPDAKPEGGTT